MKLNILVIGRHKEIVATLLRLLNKNVHWTAASSLQDEGTIDLFNQRDFDIVLLSSGIPEESERMLCAYFRQSKPNTIIIQHYGGGSGLLTNEILHALEQQHPAKGLE